MKCRDLYLWIAGACLLIAGCQQQSQSNWLLINFEENVPLTYRFVSERDITIDLTGGSEEKKTKPQTMSEKLDMVITYTPLEVDPFGLTKLTAQCRSAKVTRSSMSGREASSKDAMENLPGKTFTLTLSPTGQIVDDTDMMRVIKEIGETAFVRDDTRRIKNPDMINDFVAMQWHLWDSTSTIEEPLAGMQPGQTWQVKQWLPWPAPIPRMPMRLTTYTLDSFVEQNETRKVVITSTYELTDAGELRFPYPYEGRFQMRGLMGFLRNYKFISLEGTGRQIFNMRKGIIESDRQDYTLNVNASFMLPLGGSAPVLTIDQSIEIEQIENP